MALAFLFLWFYAFVSVYSHLGAHRKVPSQESLVRDSQCTRPTGHVIKFKLTLLSRLSGPEVYTLECAHGLSSLAFLRHPLFRSWTAFIFICFSETVPFTSTSRPFQWPVSYRKECVPNWVIAQKWNVSVEVAHPCPWLLKRIGYHSKSLLQSTYATLMTAFRRTWFFCSSSGMNLFTTVSREILNPTQLLFQMEFIGGAVSRSLRFL